MGGISGNEGILRLRYRFAQDDKVKDLFRGIGSMKSIGLISIFISDTIDPLNLKIWPKTKGIPTSP